MFGPSHIIYHHRDQRYGTHHLRAWAADNAGNWSSWTTPPLFTFRYDATPPTAPAVITETHGVVSNIWQVTVDDPDFIWSEATDGGSGVAGYDVYWGTCITGTSPAIWRTSASYNPSTVPSETAYYLRVRTKDNAGNLSAWTDPFAFKYDVTPPDNPTTVDPGCPAGDGVWQNTCDDPDFTWSGASDGGSGVAGYNVYWGTSITGTSPATGTTAAAYNPPAVPSGVPHHLRAQTGDNVDNWSEWTPLFTLQYDGQPPLISDTIPANGSVITSAWPVISATLYDPQPGSGVQPLSTTLILDSQVVTPQVNTAGGFAYTPSVRLADGVHSVTAQVYDQAGNQAQSGPWSFTVDDDSLPPWASPSTTTTVTYGQFVPRVQRDGIAMRQDDVVYPGLPGGSRGRLPPCRPSGIDILNN